MSRTGSFPIHRAMSLIQKYAEPNSVILDPFCGKGTTLLSARLMGFAAYGLDIAPEAVICSKAKMAPIDRSSVLNYIDQLDGARTSEAVPSSVRVFYHQATLRTLLSVRRRLLEDLSSRNDATRANAVFSTAACLGVLHGHSAISLSLPCSHAYSMSPEYVKRFARKHHLVRPKRDVRACLKAKVFKCLAEPLPPPVPSAVRWGSAENAGIVFPELAGGVDLILTSPPYLNAQTYAKDNWLRLWFLGYTKREIQGLYLETSDIDTYGRRMNAFLIEAHRLLRRGGRMICIVGDVRLRNQRNSKGEAPTFKTGEYLAELISRSGLPFAIDHITEDIVPTNQRYFNSLATSTGHRTRRLVERVIVLSKAS